MSENVCTIHEISRLHNPNRLYSFEEALFIYETKVRYTKDQS